MNDPANPFAGMDFSNLFMAIVNSTDAAVVSKTLDGTVLSWNPAAEAIFGWSAEEMVGQSIRKIIPADRQEEEDRIIAGVVRGESSVRMETQRLHKDGSLVDIAVLVSPVRDRTGKIIGASKIARDISGEVRTRKALDEVETRFAVMADNISQLAWIADGEGWIYWYNKRWYDYTGTTLEDMQGWGWKAVHHPDHVDRVVEHISNCFRDGTEWEDTFPLRGTDGEYRWFLSRAVPLKDDAGKVICWFGTNTDITEQRAAERQITLLLREVNHRSRNLLTVVQALAERTAAEDAEGFLPRLRQRIAGLAANQDVLVNRLWREVPLRELVEAQLAFLEERLSQISVVGPHVIVQPGAAESLSMALHEMATNAEKYGALSVEEGRVDIVWDVTPDADGEIFTISWQERGGPPAKPPEKRGFGSRIIEEVPGRRLRGTVEVDYSQQGFSFVLTCPARNVLES